jgi:internalin A
MKNILFLFLFLLAINSCKDDEADIVSPNNREYTPKIITEDYGTAKLVGFVNDKSGNPLAGVTVFFGEEKTTTGSDGSYQLNTLSAGSNKRIWFQKSGYASTQKLAEIREDLPNRIDASLFPIDKTEKMNSDGGKIEGKDFSVEIKPGGFVYSDGSVVEEDVIVEATAFLTSEDEFLDAFPGEFKGTRENGTETAIESFGFIDVVLKVESGEPVQLADGVTAIIKIKAPENSPTTIPMWHYNEDKAQWIEEGVGILVDGFYTAEVSHFTPWNWDRPVVPQSKIIGRVVDNSGIPIEGASLIQTGGNRKFRLSTKSIDDGTFEMITLENFETTIEAQFDIYGSTIINYTTSPNQGQVNNIGDIRINENLENTQEPIISLDVLYITMGQVAIIRGKYFGEQKRQGYKLLLNGNDVETTKWQNDLIEFDVPNGIPEEGTIQIDRDGVLSREVNYKEGDWTCEINGNIYNNNDLPIYSDKYNIDLTEKSLEQIPDCIGNLQNLQSLILRGNQLSSIPESIGNLKNLATLNLNSNQLINLPESIGDLKNLRDLVLDYNQLNSLPKSIGNLKNLPTLDLGTNQLTTLPESIGDLENLERLEINDNQLNNLPENIGNLKNLTTLNLNSNLLINLPESIGNIQRLSSLHIYNNKLSSLPESIGNLVNLRLLTLSANQITSLPESIGNLKNLQYLYFGGNLLTSLSDSIRNLMNLRELSLSSNKLTSIPESIGNLQNLKILDLGSNRLTSIPGSIGNLQNLSELKLSSNQLTSLPVSIKSLLEKLSFLDLRYNNFSEEEKAKIEEWLPGTEIYW